MNSIINIGIIGLGNVGNAIYNSLLKKQNNKNNIEIKIYDKFKNIGNIEDIYKSNIIFICLPTLFNEITKEYDLESIYENLTLLNNQNKNFYVLIKSTILPGTTEILQDKFNNLKLVHNPEFLSMNTANDDFHNQKHIVLGFTKLSDTNDKTFILNFYNSLYDSKISLCSSKESESMKIFCNSFYAVKIQFFNELYLLCQTLNIDFNNIRDLMLKNDWINPMHTNVPGNDGKLSYGGLCFPKDTNALLNFMSNNNTPHSVLQATINERNNLRND